MYIFELYMYVPGKPVVPYSVQVSPTDMPFWSNFEMEMAFVGRWPQREAAAEGGRFSILWCVSVCRVMVSLVVVPLSCCCAGTKTRRKLMSCGSLATTIAHLHPVPGWYALFSTFI